MDIIEAIKILERHNKWRRGANIKSTDPTDLTEAIDTIVSCARNIVDYKKKKINTANDLINNLNLIENKYKPIIIDYPKSEIDNGFYVDEIEEFDDSIYLWVKENEK